MYIMETYNYSQVLKTVELFYLSSLTQGNIPVKFDKPLNETMYFKITKGSSFEETYSKLQKEIDLYLSSISKMNETGNLSTSVVTVGTQGRLSAKKHIISNHIARYKHVHGLCDARIK